MSSWPLISDFSRMLQTPKVAFRDPALRECSIEKNNLGQPKPRSGNFATVYKGFRGDGSEFAVRVFNRQGDERRERYQIVNDYLTNREVWCLVNFNYDEKGVRSASDGKLYPLLTMDWVPGVTLFEWARDRSREGYQQALAMGADVWLQLVRHLAENHVVHGDLQHGNVLVSAEGYFKLVDYDCLAVPALMGRKNLEIGMVPYQHPGRNAETPLFEGMDNFSALVIYVALRALAAAPHLWSQYVDGPDYDKLLFRKEDFERPNDSPLYRDLMNSPDDQVRDLTHYLFQLATYELQQVPPIDEVLLWCQSLDQLLSARDWDAAVQLVRRMGAGERIDQHLLPLVDEAQRRVACRESLQHALDSGDAAEIQRCYRPELLADYPAAAPLVERAKQICETAGVLATLDAAQQAQNWQLYLQTWKAHQDTMINRPEAEPYRQEVIKLLKVAGLRRLLADPRSSDDKILELWRQLESLGGHPAGEPLRSDMQRRTGQQKNLLTLKALVESAPQPPTMAHDKQIIEAWKQGSLASANQAAALRKQVEAAQGRIGAIEKLLESSKKTTLQGEKSLVDAAQRIDPSYHPVLRRRAQQASDRLKAYRKLQDALQISGSSEDIADAFRSHGSDLQILAAWRLVERTAAQKLVSEEVQCRVQLAAERVPLIKALQLITDRLPPDERDKRLLRVWKEALLDTCQDAQPWLPQYQQALARKSVLDRLNDALGNEDSAAVGALAADPLLQGYPLPPKWQAQIDELRSRQQQAYTSRLQGLTAALLDNHRASFYDLFDPKAIKQIHDQYPHHAPVICRWTESEILPHDRSGLAAAPTGAVEEIDPARFRLRWAWPAEHISDTCRLAICPQRPEPHEGPDDVAGVYEQTVRRDQYDHENGLEVEVQPDWSQHYVVVWMMVDLGFQTLYSAPLELGTLPAARRRRWFG